MCTSAASRYEDILDRKLPKQTFHTFVFSQVHQILLEYCQTCYPNVPVSTTFQVYFVMCKLMTLVMLMHMTSIHVQSMNYHEGISFATLRNFVYFFIKLRFAYHGYKTFFCSSFKVLKIDEVVIQINNFVISIGF